MGDITFAKHGRLFVVNAYITFHGKKMDPEEIITSYDCVRLAFRTIRKELLTPHGERKVAYPKIGAGYAMGHWESIAAIIDDELQGYDHTLVEYEEPLLSGMGKGRGRWKHRLHKT